MRPTETAAGKTTILSYWPKMSRTDDTLRQTHKGKFGSLIRGTAGGRAAINMTKAGFKLWLEAKRLQMGPRRAAAAWHRLSTLEQNNWTRAGVGLAVQGGWLTPDVAGGQAHDYLQNETCIYFDNETPL